jgi:hypothetical protein
VDVVAPLLVILVLLVVVVVVSAPLRTGRASAAASRDAARIDDLLAAKDAKYREIRELELDHRTGKVTDEDFRVLDRQLRAEAIDILHRLDELGHTDDPAAADDAPGRGESLR